ncbi:MAG: hypothetical protein AABX64_00525 [Nanoarchaeota archaeon]
MVLYKLPFAFFPVRDVYARDKMDIVEWLDWFAKQDVGVVGRNPNAPGNSIENNGRLFK